MGHREPPSAYGSLRGGDNIRRQEKCFVRPDSTGLAQSIQWFTESDKVELIHEREPFFGITPPRMAIRNRFYAKLYVDGLDDSILAARDEVNPFDNSAISFKALLETILKEARARHDAYIKKERKKDSHKREPERNFVNPTLVERPIADLLSTFAKSIGHGQKPEQKPDYTVVPTEEALQKTLESFYSQERRTYAYDYSRQGKGSRIARFYPEKSLFLINEDHDFVAAHMDNPRSQIVLEDLVTAEVLLEIYLREAGVQAKTVREIMARRDRLLRGLAKDHPFSFKAVAGNLEEASGSERDLEMALVAAARALGFEARHISGSSEPDGLALLRYYPEGKKSITLEAKASGGTPSLSQLDFAGIEEHMDEYKADGCLLVAPRYPGASKGNESSAAKRARKSEVSCWSVRDLAFFLRAAEAKRLTARDVLDIVLTCYTPEDVHRAIEEILKDSGWTARELHECVVDAIVELHGRLPDSPRSVDMIASTVSSRGRFREIRRQEVESAIRDIEVITSGGLRLNNGIVEIKISLEDLSGRVLPFEAKPYQRGRFKDSRPV